MLVRRNLPFEKALRIVKINRMAKGAITTRGNQVIETKINTVNSKVRFNIVAKGSFRMEVQQYRVNTSLQNLNEVPFTSSKKIIYRRNIKFTTSRKAITVCKTVGKNNTQPRNFVNKEGVSDTIQKSRSSGEASKHNKNVIITFSASGPGNIRVAGEGTYSENRNNSRGISEQHFSYEKDRWGKPSSDKSEKTQCIHLLRALQNGRFALSEISSRRKRLLVQNRSQRRLLCNSSHQNV